MLYHLLIFRNICALPIAQRNLCTLLSVDHKALSFMFYCLYCCPCRAGNFTGPTALPSRCCCQCSLHWLHLLTLKAFAYVLPSSWWPVLFATEQLLLLNFGDSALFCYGWISHQRLVPSVFCSQIVFISMTSVSDLCLHPSPIRTQEL